MLNSLNTLSYLIENNKSKALEFNDSLSDVYRYILMNKNKELVQLKEEIEFSNNYFALLKLRFGNGVEIKNKINDFSDRYLIPPISLQILLENAVKHNEFNEDTPLVIDLLKEDTSIVVRNKIKEKILQNKSSKIGLRNLNERYKLITGKEIEIHNSNNFFSVKLPLLKTTN